ncbi:hypothetical protein ACF0H5_022224 [Mactra antiquata]
MGKTKKNHEESDESLETEKMEVEEFHPLNSPNSPEEEREEVDFVPPEYGSIGVFTEADPLVDQEDEDCKFVICFSFIAVPVVDQEGLGHSL